MLYERCFSLDTKMTLGMVGHSHQRDMQEWRVELGLPVHADSTPVMGRCNFAPGPLLEIVLVHAG